MEKSKVYGYKVVFKAVRAKRLVLNVVYLISVTGMLSKSDEGLSFIFVDSFSWRSLLDLSNSRFLEGPETGKKLPKSKFLAIQAHFMIRSEFEQYFEKSLPLRVQAAFTFTTNLLGALASVYILCRVYNLTRILSAQGYQNDWLCFRLIVMD